MKRREFISLLGGAVAAWPLPLSAQQPDRVRRIGVLSAAAEQSDGFQSRIAHFRRGLRDLGYSEGGHFVLESRYAAGQYDRFDGLAAELSRAQGGCAACGNAAGSPCSAARNRDHSNCLCPRSRSGRSKAGQHHCATRRKSAASLPAFNILLPSDLKFSSRPSASHVWQC